MSQSMNPKAALNTLAGSRNEDELYDKQWVDTGLTNGQERLPSGERGFNISKTIRRKGMKYAAGAGDMEVVKEGGSKEFGKVRLNNWVEGWAKYVEETYGHRNAFAAMAVWNGSLEEMLSEFSQGTDDDGTPRMKNAESIIEKTATKLDAKLTEKQVNSGVVQGATPILIDPDFINTVRAAAPVLSWVDVVAQAGFTASYNIISARDEPSPGWASESAVRDLSSNTGSAFTMPNEDKDMKIWADVLDISDFAARALSSLDFMDLEGTSLEIRTQEWATEEAEMVVYGNGTSGGLSDGSAHDSNAPDGLYKLADSANTAYTVDKSSTSLSGDKALFSDIKQEVLGLVNDSAAMLGNLGILTSYDVFNALENEANINVRIDAFDESVNFGRDPTGPTTLSIANVPVLPDPNIRDHSYGSGQYDGNVGDVVIFDRVNFQRRALQALSSTALGQLGLADRMALFQYETPVSRSQGEFIRFLENYSVTAL